MDFASQRSQARSVLVRIGFVALALVVGLASGVIVTHRWLRSGHRGTSVSGDGALAAIDGLVFDAAGLPLGGTTVVLDWDTSSDDRGLARVPLASVRARADGGFRIGKVPAGRYRLRAHAPDHADGRLHIEVHPGQVLSTSLHLARAETLAGRVVDRGGQPIPGARVLVWSLAAPGEPPRESSTDDDGRFTVGGLGRGLHRLIAEAAGFGSVQQGLVAVPGDVPVLRMETDGHTLTGVVTAGGVPAAGARVVIGGENLAPMRETMARPDGTFLINGLGAGSYVLRASRAGEVSRPSAEVVLDRSGDRPPLVELALAAGWSIGGRVVDDQGRVLSTAEVRVEALPGDDPLPELVRPASDGSWRAGPLPAGEYRLTPRQPGFVARRSIQVSVGPGPGAPGGAEAHVLELVRGADIVGEVVADGPGGAVAGAVVRCLVPDREDLAVVADRLPLAAEAAALPSGSGHAVGRTRTTTTDSVGRFHLADMLPGQVFVEIDGPGSVPARTSALHLAPGQRVDLGRSGLRAGVRFSGRIVDEAGAPIEGARVSIGPVEGGPANPAEASVITAVTDEAGQFAAEVGAGPHQLRVVAGGMQSETRAIQVAAGGQEPPSGLTVRMMRAVAALKRQR